MYMSIKIDSAARRVALLVVALACVAAVYFAVKWFLANTIAAHTGERDVAAYAASLAPQDPRPRYTLAALDERTFLAADFTKALSEYEQATSLSPHDFRLWFDLGGARARNGDTVGAEKALRKAIELAPHYSRIHWTLGNLLLREGSTEEAFVEIRKAVENDASYATPAVNTVWQFFSGDVALITQKIGDSNPIKAALSAYLAKQQRFDEALNLWNALPEGDRQILYHDSGSELVKSLFAAKRFRDALGVEMQINPRNGEQPQIGKIINAGFESNVAAAGAGDFEWKIADGLQPQIGFDEQQKHGGNRSLVIVFNSPSGQDFRAVQQMIAVESGRNYHFEAFARSDLKNPGTVRWEIADAADGKILAATSPVPPISDWMPIAAEFTTAPTTQAVIVRLARVGCGASLCPINGKVWFDDFSLRQ